MLVLFCKRRNGVRLCLMDVRCEREGRVSERFWNMYTFMKMIGKGGFDDVEESGRRKRRDSK